MNRQEQQKQQRWINITRRGLVMLMLILCGFFLGFVGLTAETSKLQYDVNQLNRQIEEAEKRIIKLDVKIKSATNINTIEKRAIEMGMIYPDYDQIVYLKGDSGIEEFALALMESVY